MFEIYFIGMLCFQITSRDIFYQTTEEEEEEEEDEEKKKLIP
jgi:hypothetical protein